MHCSWYYSAVRLSMTCRDSLSSDDTVSTTELACRAMSSPGDDSKIFRPTCCLCGLLWPAWCRVSPSGTDFSVVYVASLFVHWQRTVGRSVVCHNMLSSLYKVVQLSVHCMDVGRRLNLKCVIANTEHNHRKKKQQHSHFKALCVAE